VIPEQRLLDWIKDYVFLAVDDKNRFEKGHNNALQLLEIEIRSGRLSTPPAKVEGVLPCPFCGGEPQRHSNGVTVQCPTIPCPMNAGWTFIEHWNTRHVADNEGGGRG
jgi:hypothetical protein